MATSLLKFSNTFARTFTKHRAFPSVALAVKRCQSSQNVDVMNVPETKVSTLQNGFRIASEDSGEPTTTHVLRKTNSIR